MNKIAESYKRLNRCRAVAKEKGDAGEEIAVNLALEFQETTDCILLWSYSYPYQTYRDNRVVEGNFKWDGKEVVELTKEGYSDEIDLVIITDYRIFVIECKARSGKWLLYDHWAKQNSAKVDKVPHIQCEKHCRHFYHLVREFLPDGKADYIQPLTVYVDKCSIKDNRSIKYKKYMPICIANTFKRTLKSYNKPLEYSLYKRKIFDFLLTKGDVVKAYA